MKAKPEYKIFADIISAINNPNKSIDEILHIIMTNISKLVHAEAWSLLVVDENRNQLVFQEVFGEKKSELTGVRIPMDKGVAGWVVMNKKPVMVSNAYNDERFFDKVDRKTKFTTRSILAVPMITKGKVVGVVEVLNKKGGDNFTKDDLDKINAYIQQAALALENANLMKKLTEKVGYLTLIASINRSITSILQLDTLLKKSAYLIRNAFNYHYVCIGLIKGKNVILQGYSISNGSSPRNSIIPAGEGIVGHVVKTRKRMIVDNILNDKKYKKGIADTMSEMVIPIKRKGQILGVIDIGSKKEADFSDENAEIIEQVALQLGVAIENAKLYENLRESAFKDELTGLYNSRYTVGPMRNLIENARISNLPVTLIFLDLDHFKWVNDSFDHIVGSTLLKKVAQRIMRVIKKEGIGIRYGGDEYIIVLPGKTLKEGVELAELLRKRISGRKFKISKEIYYRINASFGVSSFPEPAENIEELIRTADIAMYKVKELGRNNTAFLKIDGRIELVNQ